MPTSGLVEGGVVAERPGGRPVNVVKKDKVSYIHISSSQVCRSLTRLEYVASSRSIRGANSRKQWSNQISNPIIFYKLASCLIYNDWFRHRMCDDMWLTWAERVGRRWCEFTESERCCTRKVGKIGFM